MRYAIAFPDFPADAIPADNRSADWEDVSFRHDLCPAFWSAQVSTDGVRVVVWVDYPNPADREDPTLPRFGVQYCHPDAVCYGELFSAETWKEAQSLVAGLLANMNDRPAAALLYPSTAA